MTDAEMYADASCVDSAFAPAPMAHTPALAELADIEASHYEDDMKRDW